MNSVTLTEQLGEDVATRKNGNCIFKVGSFSNFVAIWYGRVSYLECTVRTTVILVTHSFCVGEAHNKSAAETFVGLRESHGPKELY